jgi:hypothetical protein
VRFRDSRVRFRDSHSRVPGEKSHLDVGPVERCRVYYKGEGGGFPQVRALVNLVCPCCPWFVLAPKVFQLCTNHLVWVLCRPVWVSEACQLFLVPSRSSSMPLYPSKCCELGNVPRLLLLLLFSTWTHIWVFQGIGSASHPESNSQSGSSFGSVRVHSFTLSYTPKNMKCDSRVSLLALTFANLFFSREPKTRVAT